VTRRTVPVRSNVKHLTLRAPRGIECEAPHRDRRTATKAAAAKLNGATEEEIRKAVAMAAISGHRLATRSATPRWSATRPAPTAGSKLAIL